MTAGAWVPVYGVPKDAVREALDRGSLRDFEAAMMSPVQIGMRRVIQRGEDDEI